MSKRRKREIGSLASRGGIFMNINSRLIEFIKELGGSSESLNRLAKPEGDETLKAVACVIINDARSESRCVPGRFLGTVIMGSYPTSAILRQTILAGKKNIGHYADQILEKIEISSEKIRIDLREVRVAELGFSMSVPRNVIYQRALEFGLEKVPAEAIYLYLIKYKDRKLRIGGMEPMVSFEGNRYLLYLGSDEHSLFIDTHYAHPDYLWYPGASWLFTHLQC